MSPRRDPRARQRWRSRPARLPHGTGVDHDRFPDLPRLSLDHRMARLRTPRDPARQHRRGSGVPAHWAGPGIRAGCADRGRLGGGRQGQRLLHGGLCRPLTVVRRPAGCCRGGCPGSQPARIVRRGHRGPPTGGVDDPGRAVPRGADRLRSRAHDGRGHAGRARQPAVGVRRRTGSGHGWRSQSSVPPARSPYTHLSRGPRLSRTPVPPKVPCPRSLPNGSGSWPSTRGSYCSSQSCSC